MKTAYTVLNGIVALLILFMFPAFLLISMVGITLFILGSSIYAHYFK